MRFRTIAFGLTLALTASSAMAQVRFSGEALDATVQVMSWRDIPFRSVVRQQHDFSCGSAALATLLTHQYGRPTTEVQAFSAMYAKGDQDRIRAVGFSMLDMKRYLETISIKADGYRMSLDDIAARQMPAIVLIDHGSYRHFVVIKGITADRVLVGDPAFGLRIYSRKAFVDIWNGVAFMLHEDAELERPDFNLANEWRPWSTAPIGMGFNARTIAQVTNDQLPLYQISPVRGSDLTNIRGSQ